MNASMASGVSASPDWMRSAAQPAAWGLAMLVPEFGVVPPPRALDTMATPGAKMSVDALLFENTATMSWLSLAPTEMTLLRHPGATICVPEPSFPAAANVVTPLARSVLTAAAPAIV